MEFGAESKSSSSPTLLADWDADRNGAFCALAEAMDQMPKRDEFVRQLREACAYFEDYVANVFGRVPGRGVARR